MDIQYATLETCSTDSDTVVVIDVCRAFTTAPYAFAAGASEITLVGAVEEAFALRERMPGALIMGEVGGLPVEGFDFGNSPNEFVGVDLTDRRLIQRTSAGTQGVVRTARAETLLTGSFVVAAATARYIHQRAPRSVTLVTTGWRDDRPAVEDAACADYLAALLAGERPEVTPFLDRARGWLSYVRDMLAHLDARQPGVPSFEGLSRDMDRCLDVDRFDFALRVERREGRLVMVAVKEGS